MIDDKKVIIPLKKQPLESERREINQRRNMIISLVAISIFCLVAGLILGNSITSAIYHKQDSLVSSNDGVMDEIEYIMENYWLYGDDYDDLKKELEDRAYYGMTTFSEDPYTTYMSVDEINEFSTSINMDYVGIGVQFSLLEDIATINKVFKNSPAEKAGLQVGDIIKKVDGVSIEGCDTTQIKEKVVGEDGTAVIISVLREGKMLDVSVIRGAVDSSVYAYISNGIPVLELMSFGEATGKECVEYLNDFVAYDRLIIDLRDNSGGYQSSVEEIAGLFIGNNEIYMKQKDVYGNTRNDYTKCTRTYDNFKKIVILINSNTASAAEVMAICLKESLDDVTLVGTTTFGKGVVQSNRILSNGGDLKFTSSMWYSPNGVSIHKEGVKPDIEVKLPDVMYEYVPNMEDEQIYDVDEVSGCIRFIELAMEYLDYDVERTDGYFDESLSDALRQFKMEKGLGDDGLLDNATYEAVISALTYESSKNQNKDTQICKAIELLKE